MKSVILFMTLAVSAKVTSVILMAVDAVAKRCPAPLFVLVAVVVILGLIARRCAMGHSTKKHLNAPLAGICLGIVTGIVIFFLFHFKGFL
jgi:hypothetical protein